MAAAAAAVLASGEVSGRAAFAQAAGPPGTPPAAGDAQPSPPFGGPGFMHRHGRPGFGMQGPMMGPGGPAFGMQGPMMGPGGPAFGMQGPLVGGGPLTGLVAPREDKAITADEAVRIAEGLLLWMGEREWKIANAKQEDGVVRFDLTTKEGSRIATFTMDRRTGRLRRVG